MYVCMDGWIWVLPSTQFHSILRGRAARFAEVGTLSRGCFKQKSTGYRAFGGRGPVFRQTDFECVYLWLDLS